MSEWPKGWSEAEIKSIAHEVVVGFVGTTTPFYRESGIPYLTGKNIKNGSIDLEKIDFVSEEFDLEEKKSSLSPGDVVVVRIGRSGDAAVVPESLPKANCGGLVVIKRPLAVSPRFLSYYLNSPLGISSSRAEARGATRQTLNTKNIAEKVVPVPPCEEQTRIVEKLDELLAQVDTLKARIDGIPALLKRFRQSVLAAAVSGQLTEEWRALNPSLSPISADDLKKAWADVYRSDGRKYKEADLLPGELGYPLPDSWVEAKVGEVFDVYVGATPSRENTVFWGGAIPWVSSSEVAFCRIKATRESITEAGYNSASTTIHPAGTVMLAMIGQGKTRGQPAILDIEACHNQNTAAIRVHPDYCSSEYLYYYLYERYEETRRVGSGNNQQALNKKAVQSLPFPLPPLAEQTEIVRRVEQLFAFADQLEAKVKNAKARIDRLTQSILAKAFRGELVPQDPSDEPACELLARIQAQRAAAPKAKRGRKSA